MPSTRAATSTPWASPPSTCWRAQAVRSQGQGRRDADAGEGAAPRPDRAGAMRRAHRPHRREDVLQEACGAVPELRRADRDLDPLRARWRARRRGGRGAAIEKTGALPIPVKPARASARARGRAHGPAAAGKGRSDPAVDRARAGASAACWSWPDSPFSSSATARPAEGAFRRRGGCRVPACAKFRRRGYGTACSSRARSSAARRTQRRCAPTFPPLTRSTPLLLPRAVGENRTGQIWEELWIDGRKRAHLIFDPPLPPDDDQLALQLSGRHAARLRELSSGSTSWTSGFTGKRRRRHSSAIGGGELVVRK